MTLKLRTSIFISVVFTILFGIVSTIIVVLFSNYRKEEFKERLEEKAMTTIKLLIEVKEVDNQLLKVIDQNSINQLYNEKTLVFDSDYKLIYSSLDDTKINWHKSDLEFLKKHKSFFKKDGENEIYGVFYDSNSKDYFALISANDNFGNRKLSYLIYLLLGAYVIFTTATWLLTFYVVKRQVAPLDYFLKNISSINEHNLESRLQINNASKNEIDLIGKEFNFMMNRIEAAYQKQKEFTAQASHELRTPLARISAQLENQQLVAKAMDKVFFKGILADVNQLNELLNSLLILSKAESQTQRINETARVDEAIYNSIEKTHKQFSDFKVNLSISNDDSIENLLIQKCNQQLLEIAISNLLKNAYLYSDNQQVNIEIKQLSQQLVVVMSNTGETLSKEEEPNLFQSFMRGANAQHKTGFGLGLKIVARILNAYHYKISYRSEPRLNQFIIVF
jgi:two-component system, OmpR family, sensor histidine kinase ArlS